MYYNKHFANVLHKIPATLNSSLCRRWGDFLQYLYCGSGLVLFSQLPHKPAREMNSNKFHMQKMQNYIE